MNLTERLSNIISVPKVDVREEYKRHKSQTARMLELFKKRGELNTADLMRIGTGCSSRVRELRNEGHRIVAVYERPGVWRYVYLGQEDD